MRAKTLLPTLISAIILLGGSFFVDFSVIGESLRTISLLHVVYLVGLTFLTFFLKAIRWHYMIQEVGNTDWLLDVLSSFGSSALLFFAPNVTADAYKGGIASQIYDTVSFREGTAASLFEKLLGLIILLLISFAGLLFYAFFIDYGEVSLFLVIFVVISTLFGFLFHSSLLHILSFFRDFMPLNSVKKILRQLKLFVEDLHGFKDSFFDFAVVICLTMIIEALLGLRIFAFFQAIGINVSILVSFVLYSVSSVIGAISMLPLGLGSKDVAFTSLSVLFGLSPETGSVGAILDRATMLLLLPLFAGCFIYLNHVTTINWDGISKSTERTEL